jgi:hypothetical protein
MSLKVQEKKCETCIYGRSPLDLKKLLDQVRDPHMRGHFRTYRICHHSEDAVCRGFWDAHRNDFAVGQVAQRLNQVEFVDVDTLGE